MIYKYPLLHAFRPEDRALPKEFTSHMAVIIRLRRMGRTNAPFFRVVAADERTSTNGRFLENLGWYDPKKSGRNFELKLDRIEHWLDNGARISDTARNLIKQAKSGEFPVAVEPEPEPAPAPAPAVEEPAAEAPAEPAADPAETVEDTPPPADDADTAQKDG